MGNAGSPGGRHSLVVPLSLGSLALGIGFIGVALVNCAAQSVSPAESVTFETRLIGAAGDGSASTNTVDAARPVRPPVGVTLGRLTIPALGQEFPIIQGVGDEELKKGVGHMPETALPGEADNCVISGHRDTVFTRLGELKVGDRLVVRTLAGTFTYAIRRIRIVDKDDRTVVVPADHAVLTVSTCYPFRYVGAAPDRFVLSADLVTGK